VHLPAALLTDPATEQPLPSLSMSTTMAFSVSSTFVTVCAFNPNCFLRNVSMSTSILCLPVACKQASKRLDVSGFHNGHSAASLFYLKRFKFIKFNLHFWERNPILRFRPLALLYGTELRLWPGDRTATGDRADSHGLRPRSDIF